MLKGLFVLSLLSDTDSGGWKSSRETILGGGGAVLRDSVFGGFSCSRRDDLPAKVDSCLLLVRHQVQALTRTVDSRSTPQTSQPDLPMSSTARVIKKHHRKAHICTGKNSKMFVSRKRKWLAQFSNNLPADIYVSQSQTNKLPFLMIENRIVCLYTLKADSPWLQPE